ncbi:hypothetical protein EJB05_38878 [Eragrostis curvula]|uniref:Uncharacterized protein n=1 Tax=Eragrostis curvula TaxID=38414 RepID=A0A5J9TVB9_9POAL|nr:hypothetical protein EJB05_38878 [Eragrostis curvula]
MALSTIAVGSAAPADNNGRFKSKEALACSNITETSHRKLGAFQQDGGEQLPAAEIIMYGPSDIGFAPYGEHWRQARKLVTTHLLSAKKVQAFRRAREEEVGAVMAGSARRQPRASGGRGRAAPVVQERPACRAVMGESFRSEGRNMLFRELVADTSPLLAGFNVEEFFPFLARFGLISKVVRTKSERVKRRWDEMLDRLIQDHEGKYGHGASAEDDFIHVLLSVREEYSLTRDQMKAILLDVFFGGIESSASVLKFTIAELMRWPHVMKKPQAEVRAKGTRGTKELVSEDN